MCLVKVFKSGNSQAVRVPKDSSVAGTDLVTQKVGNPNILTPKQGLWEKFRNSLDKFTDDFMKDGREQGPNQEREEL